MKYLESDALFSRDGRYRYVLFRRWADGPVALFICLNPSTADKTRDDPTIRRCVGFARREGCGALQIGNLSGFRSTDPTQLPSAEPIIRRLANEAALSDMRDKADLVVAAWGAHPLPRGIERTVAMIAAWPGVQCLGRTRRGQPRHPLYLRRDTPLEPWSEPDDGS